MAIYLTASMFTQYQIDTFTNDVFGGNPAAVVPLKDWIPDTYLQKIAQENNLSETAFFVPEGDGYRLRWFTPTTEVDLCGHATLATAYVLFFILDFPEEVLTFHTRSGELYVQKKGNLLEMNFPLVSTEPTFEYIKAVEDGLGIKISSLRKAGWDLLAIVDSEAEVRSIQPLFEKIAKLPARGLVCTAPGDQVDFVSRFFGPQVGVPEDPVTGSAHTYLAPYWAHELGKTKLIAHQVSHRTGELELEIVGDRVLIRGNCKIFMEGKIYLA